jgi:dTDP-4-amino-4,6-dideoxygalactose transaminase
MSFDNVKKFEEEIASFFGSPYSVAVDCCTHGIELCLRYKNVKKMIVPVHTYISVPLLSKKLNIELEWKEENWLDYYYIGDTNIIDAAVLWKKDSYIPNTFMCVSFQFRKHLSLGRGGAILCDNLEDYKILKRMSYDGRVSDIPWAEQNIKIMGYHYYMTPETAKLGLEKLEQAKNSTPKQWTLQDWPDLRNMEIFK